MTIRVPDFYVEIYNKRFNLHNKLVKSKLVDTAYFHNNQIRIHLNTYNPLIRNLDLKIDVKMFLLSLELDMKYICDNWKLILPIYESQERICVERIILCSKNNVTKETTEVVSHLVIRILSDRYKTFIQGICYTPTISNKDLQEIIEFVKNTTDIRLSRHMFVKSLIYEPKEDVLINTIPNSLSLIEILKSKQFSTFS